MVKSNYDWTSWKDQQLTVNQRLNVWWQKQKKVHWIDWNIFVYELKERKRLHCSHTVNILVRRLFICLMFMLCFIFFSTLLSFCGQIGCVPGIWWHHWRLLGRSFSFCCVCLNMIDCIKMVALKKNNPQPSRLLLAKCELCSFFFHSCCTESKLHNPIPCYKLSLFLSLSVALLPLHMFDLWNPTSFHHMAHLWLPHSLYRPFVLTLSS